MVGPIGPSSLASPFRKKKKKKYGLRGATGPVVSSRLSCRGPTIFVNIFGSFRDLGNWFGRVW